MKKLDFQNFFAFLRIFSSSLVKLSCYKPYKLYTPYKLYKPFTNFLLEGMESSVLQTFYKPYNFYKLYKLYNPYKLYKPFSFVTVQTLQMNEVCKVCKRFAKRRMLYLRAKGL